MKCLISRGLLWLLFFCMSGFFSISVVSAQTDDSLGLQSEEVLYNPGDMVTCDLSWEALNGVDSGFLYIALVEPSGKTSFLTPSGFVSQCCPLYNVIDLSQKGHLQVFEYPYPKDVNFPQGVYTAYALVTENDALAVNDPSRWLGPVLSESFTFTSHEIPVTFPDYDFKTRMFHVVSVANGIWIVFTSPKSDESGRHPLYAMKLAFDGHTLIAPVKVGHVRYERLNPNNNLFYIMPDGEGVRILAVVPDIDRPYRNDLEEIDLDGKGHVYRESLWIKDRNYLGLWATTVGSTMYALALYDDGIFLLKKEEDTFSEYRISPENISVDYDPFFKVVYDQGSFYVFYGEGISHFYFSKINCDGNVEKFCDLSGQIEHLSSRYIGWPEDTFIIGDEIFFLKTGNPAEILFFNRDGSLARQVNLEDPISIYGTGAFDVELSDDALLVFWRAGSRDFMGAAFDFSGHEMFSPTDLYSGSDTSNRPRFIPSPTLTKGLTPFAGGLLLYSEYAEEPYSIKGLFFSHDFSIGQPDLAISEAHLTQEPGYALPGSEVRLIIDVYNRGEDTNEATTLRLNYFGHEYTKHVGAIPPGDKETVSFTVENPPYLTAKPTLDIVVDADDYLPNNEIHAEVTFPPATPIYPEGSQNYNWTVKNSASNEAIPGVYVRYEIPGINTTGLGITKVKLMTRADEGGSFQAILPAGDYTFYLSKTGYPKTYRHVIVPGGNNVFYLEPPGDLVLNFQESDGQPLHPTPLSISVHLTHNYDAELIHWEDYQYDVNGSENGCTVRDVMPGTYNVETKAFGYYPLGGRQIQVTGGIENRTTLCLEPYARGKVQGKIVSGEKGISGATVQVAGSRYETTTDRNGNFSLTDFPLDGSLRSLVIMANKYAGKRYDFTAQGEPGDEINLGEIALAKISVQDVKIERARFALYNQVVSWDVGDSYGITNLYGVGEFQGSVQYQKVGDVTQATALTLSLAGYFWNYANVDLDVVDDEDILFSYEETCDEIVSLIELPGAIVHTISSLSDVPGTVSSLVDIGNLDELADIQIPGNNVPVGKLTILRLDDIVLYDGNEKILDTYPQQYYSSQYQQLTFPLNERQVSLNDLKLRIYFSTMNGDHRTSPLDLIGANKVYFEWKFKDGKIHFNGISISPSDYPDYW